jgi:hypothetical protein
LLVVLHELRTNIKKENRGNQCTEITYAKRSSLRGLHLGSFRGLDLGSLGRVVLVCVVLSFALSVRLGLAGYVGRGCLLLLGLLFADQAGQIGSGLASLVDAGLGLGRRLASQSTQNTAKGVGVGAEETLGVDWVVSQIDEL